MAKLLPGGFFELSPPKQELYNQVSEIIKQSFQKFGYINIQTASVEFTSTLLAKGGDEVAKQVFGLYDLKFGADTMKPYALHFDLTVPFARYTLDNEEHITFPFKRYQMQNVFRGEKQQRGRFKEFTQCDIDIIAKDISIEYEREVLQVLYFTLEQIFTFLNINKKIELRMNSRKYIDAIAQKFSLSSEKAILFFSTLDKYYKLPAEVFENELRKIFSEDTLQIIEILKTPLDNISQIFPEHQGIQEIQYLYSSLKNVGVNVIFDPYITRGLDYYSGVVFETFIEGYNEFGSICSGGRYDNLVKGIKPDIQVDYKGIGGSIGLSRLFSCLDEAGLIQKQVSLVDFMIFNLEGRTDIKVQKLVEIIQKSGFRVDVYYQHEPLGKQFKYAMNKNITYGIFIGGEEIKQSIISVKHLDLKQEIKVGFDDFSEFLGKIKEKFL